jgi:hypothetical protein
MIMKLMWGSTAVAAALVTSAVLAQNAGPANPLANAAPAAMAAALASAVTKGEISEPEAAEVAKMIDRFTAEMKGEEFRRKLEGREERAVTQGR